MTQRGGGGACMTQEKGGAWLVGCACMSDQVTLTGPHPINMHTHAHECMHARKGQRKRMLLQAHTLAEIQVWAHTLAGIQVWAHTLMSHLAASHPTSQACIRTAILTGLYTHSHMHRHSHTHSHTCLPAHTHTHMFACTYAHTCLAPAAKPSACLMLTPHDPAPYPMTPVLPHAPAPYPMPPVCPWLTTHDPAPCPPPPACPRLATHDPAPHLP